MKNYVENGWDEKTHATNEKEEEKYTLKIKKIIKHTNWENTSLTCAKNNYKHIA